MRWAFKEWAVIVDALRRGEQIVVLRKGGLREGRGGFQVEQSDFWLFPTQFHQQRESVLPSAQARFDAMMAAGVSGAADSVRLDCFARVVEWRRLDSLEAAQRLRGQHVWRDEVIAERFDWGSAKGIFALAVRVFRLPHEVVLPMSARYGGCLSWVELETDVATDGATPVLGDAAFAQKLELFREALGVAADPVASS